MVPSLLAATGFIQVEPPALPLDVLVYGKRTVEGTELRARYPFGDRDMMMKGPFTPVAVSPDGRFLAFRHQDQLRTTGLFFLPRQTGSDPARFEWQLTAPIRYSAGTRSWSTSRLLAERYGGRPAYAPNGSSLFYIRPERTSGEGSLMRLALTRNGWKAGEPVQLTNIGSPSSGGDFGAAVSPDGRTVLLNSYFMLAGIAGKSLGSVPAAGGELTRIPGLDGGFINWLTWAPDGSRIAFQYLRTLPLQSGIYTAAPDGSRLAFIEGTQHNDQHVVYGQSGEIYFSRNEARFSTDEASDIWVWRGRGAPERLAGEPGAIEYPVAVIRLTSTARPR